MCGSWIWSLTLHDQVKHQVRVTQQQCSDWQWLFQDQTGSQNLEPLNWLLHTETAAEESVRFMEQSGAGRLCGSKQRYCCGGQCERNLISHMVTLRLHESLLMQCMHSSHTHITHTHTLSLCYLMHTWQTSHYIFLLQSKYCSFVLFVFDWSLSRLLILWENEQ